MAVFREVCLGSAVGIFVGYSYNRTVYMPTLKRSDCEIYYELTGAPSLPVVVLSSSLGADSSMWDPQMASFGTQFRILRYDNRGHGKSSASPGPYTIDLLAGDVVALLDEVGEKTAFFCGLSMGGMVGMWLGWNFPDRIRRLALCNTAAWLGPPDNWDTRITAVLQGGMPAISKAVLERWFTQRFSAASPAAIAPIEKSLLETKPEGYIGCCQAIREMDQREKISAIAVRTMVLAGTFDPSTPPALGQEIAGKIAEARYVELPSAHLSNVETAAAFNDVICRFFLQQK